VNFLESRLQRAHRVLEFGSGYSTLWLAQRVREVIALEDNERWVALVARQLPPNARVIHVGAFTPEALSAVTDLGLFDFVVVDCNGD
jgi:predicted O-methyltransferase YrrM